MLQKIAIGLGGVAVIGLAAWVIYSLAYDAGTEEAPYTIVRTAGDYEVRRYPSLLVAETPMTDMSRQSTNEAFWVLAKYIFGGNVGAESIAMTAPVTMQPEGQKIAMTAPVLMGIAGKNSPRSMAFVMPSKYNLATLPKPLDSRVTFRQTDPRVVAVMRYTWYPTPERFAANAATLLQVLKRDNIEVKGEPMFAGFDAPFVVPFLMRNEVHIPIADQWL